jgi:RNA polymerase sigma factor for flagellar operon FliA
MLDEVRRLSFLPRSAVAFDKSRERNGPHLGLRVGTRPTQVEIAEFMGKDVEEFHKDRGKAMAI